MGFEGSKNMGFGIRGGQKCRDLGFEGLKI